MPELSTSFFGGRETQELYRDVIRAARNSGMDPTTDLLTSPATNGNTMRLISDLKTKLIKTARTQGWGEYAPDKTTVQYITGDGDPRLRIILSNGIDVFGQEKNDSLVFDVVNTNGMELAFRLIKLKGEVLPKEDQKQYPVKAAKEGRS